MKVMKKPAAMKKPATKHARLGAFARGMIYMGFLTGMTYLEIQEEVEKDGGYQPSKQTIATDCNRSLPRCLY